MQLPFRKIGHQVLFWFVLAISAGILFIGVFVTTRLRDRLTGQFVESQRRVAASVIQGMSITFEELQGQLEQFAEQPEIQGNRPDACQEAIFRFLHRNPMFHSGCICDPDGKVTAIAFRNRSRRGADQVGRRLPLDGDPGKHADLVRTFRETVSRNEGVVSESNSSVSRGTQLLMTVPIRPVDAPDRVKGVFFAGIHLDGAFLHGILQKFEADNGLLVLTDRQGAVLAQRGGELPAGLERVTIVSPPPAGQSASLWTTIRGREFLTTIQPFPAVDGFLIIGHSRETALGLVNEIVRGILLLGVFAVFSVGVAGFMVVSGYLAQILKLAEGLGKVGDGVLSWRIDDTSPDEIGQACRAFNGLAEKLERNQLVEDLWLQRWKPPA